MCMTTWVSIKFILLLLLLHANFLTATTRGKVSPFVIPTCIFNSSLLFKCSSIFSSNGSGFIQKATFSRETRSWNSPTANYNPVLSSLPFPLPRCRHLGEHTNTQNMIYRDTKENCYLSLMCFGNRCLWFWGDFVFFRNTRRLRRWGALNMLTGRHQKPHRN